MPAVCHAGAVLFKQKLSQIATMYKDAKGGFEAKVRAVVRRQPSNRTTHDKAGPPTSSRVFKPVSLLRACSAQPGFATACHCMMMR